MFPSSPRAFSHCHACGTDYASQAWPRTCFACRRVVYRNPTPVALAVVPVRDGVVGVCRAITPGLGEWALPGGYIDEGETAEQAASRELREEAGLHLPPEAFQAFGTDITQDGLLLIWCRSIALTETQWAQALPGPEASQVGIVRVGRPLAFPLHEAAVRRALEGPLL